MTQDQPYSKDLTLEKLQNQIMKLQERPKFQTPIPTSYQELIKRCWSEDPKSRPTFDEILHELKTNPDFITDKVDISKYNKYIEMIDNSNIIFESDKRIPQIKEYIESRSDMFPDHEINIISKGIYQTEFNNVYFFDPFKTINQFKKKEPIFPDKKTLLLFHYVDIKTGKDYILKRCDNFIQASIELNIFRKIDEHPGIINFYGYTLIYSKAIALIYDFYPNGPLKAILDNAKNGTIMNGWNDTKKLINIYGIAATMSYLHSIGIIHLKLNPRNIFLDDNLYPIIYNFAYSKDLSNNVFYKEDKSLLVKTDYYEILYEPFENTATKEYDVYSFSMIAYEIITNDYHYGENIIKSHQILRQKSCNDCLNYRKQIPKCYKDLIEKCHNINSKERPTFDEIVYELKTNPDFITDTVNRKEYFEYIKYIDNYYQNNYEYNFQKTEINLPNDEIKLDFSLNIKSTNLEKYRKIDKIGKGGFGKVYTIFDKEKYNDILAAKVSLSEMDSFDVDLMINLSREIDIISQLNHPCILKYIGYNPRNFKYKPKPTIITEFASNSSIDKFIQLESNNCGIKEWNDTKKLINIYGIAAGMNYLHNKNILHRDLKSENIFLDDFLYPKIGDFGLSKKISDNKQAEPNIDPSGYKGTYAYSAPEVLYNYEYSKKGDVYSYGMIVYEIMTTVFPFKDLNFYQLSTKILQNFQLEFKNSIPDCYKNLINKCISKDPNERPTFSQILNIIEKDPDFITSNIDKKEFLEYVQFVKTNENNEKTVFLIHQFTKFLLIYQKQMK